MMTVADDLRAARALIDTPEKWTIGAFERINGQGAPCYCSIGALRTAVTGSTTLGEADEPALMRYLDARFAVERLTPRRNLAAFNDKSAHADILALFDRAIQAAEAS